MPSVQESVDAIKLELKNLKEQGAISDSAVSEIQSLLPRPQPVPAKRDVEIVEALYAFKAQQEGDLDLNVGDKIEVLEKLSPEWHKGKCNGKIGVFPSNYVKRVEDRAALVPVSSASSSSAAAALPQYASYTPPPAQVTQQQQYPPQFSSYYQQPQQQAMQQMPMQQMPVQQMPMQQMPPQQQVQQQQQAAHSHGAGSETFKKFGSKLGNAAIFGAGATIGSDLVNSIFN